MYSQTKNHCLISENHPPKKIRVHLTQISLNISSFDGNLGESAAILDFDEIPSFKICTNRPIIIIKDVTRSVKNLLLGIFPN